MAEKKCLDVHQQKLMIENLLRDCNADRDICTANTVRNWFDNIKPGFFSPILFPARQECITPPEMQQLYPECLRPPSDSYFAVRGTPAEARKMLEISNN